MRNLILCSMWSWGAFCLYWLISARKRQKETEDAPLARESVGSRAAHLIPLGLSFALLLWPDRNWPGMLTRAMWEQTTASCAAGLAMEWCGLGLAVWARVWLGKNWTGRITTSGAQELVVAGPYRIVRHPIYAGVLAGMAGTAVVLGEVRGPVAVALTAIAYVRKVRREEAALRERFGAGYEEYARRVAALVPGIW